MAPVIFVTGTRQIAPPALIAAVRKTANKLSFILNQIITSQQSYQSFYILCFGTLNAVTRASTLQRALGRCFVAGLLGCNLSLQSRLLEVCFLDWLIVDMISSPSMSPLSSAFHLYWRLAAGVEILQWKCIFHPMTMVLSVSGRIFGRSRDEMKYLPAYHWPHLKYTFCDKYLAQGRVQVGKMKM